MSIKDQLEAPSLDKMINGRFTLCRIHRLGAPVAVPVPPVNIEGIQEIKTGPLNPGYERQVFLKNSDEPVNLGRYCDYAGIIRIESGYASTFISQLLGITWSSVGYAVVPLRFPGLPLAVLEAVCRREDNDTHLFTKVYQDIVLKNFNFGSPQEEEIVDIPFYSIHDPFLLCAATEVVLDKFTGDGLTTEFTLSATPVSLIDLNYPSAEDWDFPNLVYVKIKEQDALTGIRQRSGVSVNGNILVFENAPPMNTELSVLYARLTD